MPNNVNKIVINGRFLTKKLTGVERYAIEIVNELDKIVKKDSIEIVVPLSLRNIPKFQNIKVVKFGKLKNTLWEQLSLGFYLIKSKALGIHLCNVVPFIKPNGIVTVHDISYAVNPQFLNNFHGYLSKKWHKLQYKIIKSKARKILTDSNFSKNEMIRYYKISGDRIDIIANAWQHFNRIEEDTKFLEKYQLNSNGFYFTICSIAKNKNFKWIINTAKNNPLCQFVIAGSLDLKVFGEQLNVGDLSNVKFLGYVSDGEAKALMKNCKAFLFPSFYEGFGIPPLEALSCGAEIIISNTSCLPEIYGNSAHYIDPYDYNIDLDKILSEKTENSEQTLNQYSWEKSAKKLLSCIKKNI